MLRVEQIDGIAVVRVYDDVDIASAPQFESCLRILRDEIALVIDLDSCPYFDSTGLSVLYRAIRNQHVLVFMPKSCPLRRIFDIVAAGQLFPIFENEDTALHAARNIMNVGERPSNKVTIN